MTDTNAILAAIGKLDEKQDKMLKEQADLKTDVAVVIDRSERTQEDVKGNKADIKENREKIVKLEKSAEAFEAFKGNFSKALWKILTPPLGYLGLVVFIIIALVVIWITS